MLFDVVWVCFGYYCDTFDIVWPYMNASHCTRKCMIVLFHEYCLMFFTLHFPNSHLSLFIIPRVWEIWHHKNIASQLWGDHFSKGEDGFQFFTHPDLKIPIPSFDTGSLETQVARLFQTISVYHNPMLLGKILAPCLNWIPEIFSHAHRHVEPAYIYNRSIASAKPPH